MKHGARRYLLLQLKRMRNAFPVVFLVTVGLAAALCLVLWMQYRTSMEDLSRQKIQVGIVGDTEDPLLQLGLSAVESFDSSQMSIDLCQMDSEDEARAALAAGTLTGYLVIPEDFVESVYWGENAKIRYVSGSSQSLLPGYLFQEFSKTLSALITETETGMYAVQELYQEGGVPLTEEAELRLNLIYIQEILSREDLYETETVGSMGDLSLIGCYVCALLLFFLLLWGMNGGALLIREDQSLGKVLRAAGLSSPGQTGSEFLAYLCLMAVSFAGICALALLAVGGAHLSIPEISGLGGWVWFLLRLWPVVLCLASLSFLLYSAASSLLSGLLLNFTGAMVLAFLSGCFYPADYFPSALQALGAVLPTGVGLRYLEGCLGGTPTGGALAGLLGYTAACLALAGLIRWRKTVRA